MPRILRSTGMVAVVLGFALLAPAQTPSAASPPRSSSGGLVLEPFGSLGASGTSPLTQPTLSPGALLLIELDARFAKAVADGGGKVFASWFAEDAVTLNNGRAPILGRAKIAADAQWDPKSYQLTWIPSGAQMGPSNDMGFTWGHYQGHATDKHGQPVLTSGRYITVWKKQADGAWKVALDASATEPAGAGECCTLPKP